MIGTPVVERVNFSDTLRSNLEARYRKIFQDFQGLLLLRIFKDFCFLRISVCLLLLFTAWQTVRKLNVHKMFRRRHGCLLNVLCRFNLRFVSTGILTTKIDLHPCHKKNTSLFLEHYFRSSKNQNKRPELQVFYPSVYIIFRKLRNIIVFCMHVYSGNKLLSR